MGIEAENSQAASFSPASRVCWQRMAYQIAGLITCSAQASLQVRDPHGFCIQHGCQNFDQTKCVHVDGAVERPCPCSEAVEWPLLEQEFKFCLRIAICMYFWRRCTVPEVATLPRSANKGLHKTRMPSSQSRCLWVVVGVCKSEIVIRASSSVQSCCWFDPIIIVSEPKNVHVCDSP